MKKVAITGNIGSGKSSCCHILAIRGFPVYDADKKAKWLMENDPELKQKISARFGPKSYSGQKLNRTYLARQVFSNEKS
ncbi:MAG: dephospho-CoA kinase, partial [Bacteroidetes bacterium]|nr:dephospho-CoA kinase [Bacteroidota bacterium]